VDADTVGVGQLVGLRPIVLNGPPVHHHGHHLIGHVEAVNLPDIAIEDVFFVIVASLNHLVAHAEQGAHQPPLGFATLLVRVEPFLQHVVQRRDADRAAVHRRQHLHIRERIEAEFGGDALLHDADQQLGGSLRVFLHEDEEIVPAVGRVRRFALVDAVRVADDLAGLCLAEDRVQPRDRTGAAVDHVVEHIARSHARELVHIADEQQVCVRVDGFQQVVEQVEV